MIRSTQTTRLQKLDALYKRLKTQGAARRESPKGFILHRGISPFNRSSYVVIATLNSENRKTGNMVQTWILPEDENPVKALATGNDAAVCGDCPLRKTLCYVNVGQAPLGVWRAYKAGRYPEFNRQRDSKHFEGRFIRFGAYGEPVLIPFHIVKHLASVALGHTGYTHQWRKPQFAKYSAYFMASVESDSDTEKAYSDGWRSFRVSADVNDRYQHEDICPNESAGISCLECLKCDGVQGGKRRSVVITSHGKQKNNLLPILESKA